MSRSVLSESVYILPDEMLYVNSAMSFPYTLDAASAVIVRGALAMLNSNVTLPT